MRCTLTQMLAREGIKNNGRIAGFDVTAFSKNTHGLPDPLLPWKRCPIRTSSIVALNVLPDLTCRGRRYPFEKLF